MSRKILNELSNFGVTLDELICFESRPKINPNQNKEALKYAIDGIELFEVPTANLGTPLEILQEIRNPAEILSYYIGLGKLITSRSITYKGGEISYNELLKEEPYMIVSKLVGYGHKYNAINIMKRKLSKKGFPKLELSLRGRISILFKKRNGLEDGFIDSLKEARKTRYYQDITEEIIGNKIFYLMNLTKELYANKNGQEFLWQFDDKVGRRMKTRSTSPGREGLIYFTWAVNGKYSCTCPARVECKHIKEIKKYQNQ